MNYILKAVFMFWAISLVTSLGLIFWFETGSSLFFVSWFLGTIAQWSIISKYYQLIEDNE